MRLLRISCRAQRNVISGCTAIPSSSTASGSAGIYVFGLNAINNTISGNYIGTDATGNNAVGNVNGVDVTGLPCITEVQDNGKSANDPPDQISFSFIGVATPCTAEPALPLNPMTDGQVTVN